MNRVVVMLEPPALIGWSPLWLVWFARRQHGGGKVAWAALGLASAYFWVATARPCRWAGAPAIVVALAGGVSGSPAAEPPVSRLKEASFRRTIAAAELALAERDARLILSGGAGWPDAEAELMQRLAVSFGVLPARIVTEARSHDTRESTVLVAGILRHLGASRIHLVTSALHSGA